jgi:hypothetical protein
MVAYEQAVRIHLVLDRQQPRVINPPENVLPILFEPVSLVEVTRRREDLPNGGGNAAIVVRAGGLQVRVILRPAAYHHGVAHRARRRAVDTRRPRRVVDQGPLQGRLGLRERGVCPGRKSPKRPVKRPARPHKNATENTLSTGNAKGA